MSNENYREIEIKIFRYNPHSKFSEPRFESYKLTETPGMTLYIALSKIWATMDHHVSFDFVCRAGICGSCNSA